MSEDVLVSIPRNPVPDGAVAGSIRTPDGKRLRFARWRATGRAAQGTILLCQGRSEFIEKYHETIDSFRARGFAVLTFDWRGQGGSERPLPNARKGHVGAIEEYETDLVAVIEQLLLPDCPPPHFLVAHSMGGFLALRSAPLIARWIDRMVLSAPFLGLSERYGPSDLLAVAARAGDTLGFGKAYAPGGGDTPGEWGPFASNTVTSDPTRFARAGAILEARPALALGGPTFRWMRVMFDAQANVALPEFGARVPVPILIVSAGADTIVSNTAQESAARLLRTCGRVVIDGAKHEAMMERDLYREQFLAAVDAFLPGTPTFA